MKYRFDNKVKKHLHTSKLLCTIPKSTPHQPTGEQQMKRIIAAAVLTFTTAAANATCYGSANIYSCTDLSGNTYNVQRYGNTTSVQGYNPNTGNSWSQQSHQYGNITNTYGTSSNGNSWSKTDTPYGSYGTNSNGQPFYYGR